MKSTFPWEAVSALLDAAMELPAAERIRFLQDACADEPLRQHVMQMIADYRDEDFLESPPLMPDGAGDRSWYGRSVGSYHLVEELGEGGMGVVYRAVRADDHYLKSAAIKLMKGDFSSSFSVMRFRVERQILATLEHPNIARLLDGGATEEGTPYLVMELIEGMPLDQYCDEHQLSVPERIRLFRQACAAVQYAHQHLVIHRDLKPKNILVTGHGEVKLLDFGIAKILDPESFPQVVEATSPLMRLLSPEYASPEQILGEQVSTASDIYSLGVVLYLLLTGRPPYSVGSGSLAELTEAVCHTEPAKPSVAVLREVAPSKGNGGVEAKTSEEAAQLRGETPPRLARHLRGDLDNILLKALRKEPDRRYQTVQQLSDDLRRHVEGLPVSARPDTLIYRAQKFVQRHRALAITSTGVAASLLLAMGITVHEADVARQQRAEAERRLHDVRDLARSNLVDVHSALEHLPGSASARHLAIQRSLKYLDQMNSELHGDIGLTREVSDAYEKIADLQGAYRGENIGDSRAAQASLAKAFELRSRVLTLPGNTPEDQAKRLGAIRKYVRCLMLNGDTGHADQMAQIGLASASELARQRPQDPGAAAALAAAHLWMAIVTGGVGSSGSTRQLDQAIEHDRTTLKMFEELERARVVGRDVVRRSESMLALHLSKARRFAEAHELVARALAEEQHLKTDERAGLSDFYNTIGLIYEREGRHLEALAQYRKTWPLVRQDAAADPQDLDAQLGLQIAEAHLGMQAARMGDHASGLKRLNAAIAAAERMQQADPVHVFYLALLVVGYAYQAEAVSLMGDHDIAVARYARAIKIAEQIGRNDATDLDCRMSAAKLHLASGVVQSRKFRFAQARSELAAAQASLANMLTARPADAEAHFYKAQISDYLGILEGCREGTRCKGQERLALPTLLN